MVKVSLYRPGALPSVVFLTVIMNHRQYGGIRPLGLRRHGQKIKIDDPSGCAIYSHSLAEIVRLNPAGAWMYDVCCECCVLSGRGL